MLLPARKIAASAAVPRLGGNPDVFALFDGFADGTPVADGRIAMPDVPDVGCEAKRALWEVMAPLARG